MLKRCTRRGCAYDMGTGTTFSLREIKVDMMNSIYNMLCTFIGRPPGKFDWQVRDKKKKFIRFEDLSPLDFYHSMLMLI